jgi:hypothetical protein
VSKTNYREPDNGLGFIIGNDETYECGFVNGLGISTVTAEDLVGACQTDGERSERDETRDLLKSILRSGPMDTADVLKATRSAGVSDTTVKRARRDLGVISTAQHDPTTGRLVGWQLSLPDHRVTPQGQPLLDPVDPLGPTRTFTRSSGPEGHPTESGPLVAAEPESEPTNPPLIREVPDVPDVPDNTGQPDGDGQDTMPLVPTLTAPCPICQAPPPRRRSFGIIACVHQLAAGLVPV